MASILPYLFIGLVSELSIVYCQSDDYSKEVGKPMHFFPKRQPSHGQFECPSIYGRYAHPDDCSVYYECRFGWPTLIKCWRGQLYDEHKEQCRDERRVDCKRGAKDHTKQPEKEKNKEEEEASFKCPYIWGSFAHPVDCSKYFVCVYNVPAVFQCRGSDLFDERARRCLNKHRVRCGHRLDRDQMRTSRKPTIKPTTASLKPSWKPITGTTKPTRKPTTVTMPRTKVTTPELRSTTVVGKQTFHCPFPYGRYPDPEDCSQYYLCRFAASELFRCPENTLYDERKELCREARHVRCGKRPGGVGGEDEEPTKEEKFHCPYEWGTFPHPGDCSKYIVCLYNVPTIYICKYPQLFDTSRRRCQLRVNCDSRINPDDLTPPTRRTTDVTSRTKTSPISTTERVTTDFPTTQTNTAPSTTDSTTTASPTMTNTKQPTTDSTTTASPTTINTRRPTTDFTGTPTTDTMAPTTRTLPPITTPSITRTTDTTTTIAFCSTSPETRTARPTTSSTTNVPSTTFSEATPSTTTTPSQTPTPSTVSPTTVPPTTATTTTPSPTTVTPTTLSETASTDETTKVTKPNTPPPTDCDEDDLECIMDKTGDVKGWFDCPQRYGHFPHGSSKQLFIHCDNFRPFVKTCADGTVFSPIHLVCMWV